MHRCFAGFVRGRIAYAFDFMLAHDEVIGTRMALILLMNTDFCFAVASTDLQSRFADKRI